MEENENFDIPESKVREPAVKYNYYTLAEYLEAERSSNLNKFELHEGYRIFMQGASVNHVRINVNLTVSIGSYLKDKPCDVFANDLKTGILSKESITYPDIVIACGALEFADNRKDVLLNPVAIIEILSPGTEHTDRGAKFFYYRQIPSFKEYILISSTEYYLFVSRKQENGFWLSYETHNPEEILAIESIGFELPLSEIYRRVSF
jgi:Uma2 family endonuclease